MAKKIERLVDYNIVGGNSKTNIIFEKIEKHFSDNTDIPSVYIKSLWDRYQSLPKKYKVNSMNGNIFEAIVITSLLKEGISPIYTQTSLEFVPNVNYDLVVFPKNDDGSIDVSAPIVISLKTSLRERYKQADLEGSALKSVYKRGISYLVTLDSESEIKKSRQKIIKKEILGLDDFINATTSDFDVLVNDLKTRTVAEPPEIKVVRSANTIIKK